MTSHCGQFRRIDASVGIPTQDQPAISGQKAATDPQCRILVPHGVEAETENPVQHNSVERPRRPMVQGIQEVADYVPFRRTPACNGQVDINGPAISAVRAK